MSLHAGNIYHSDLKASNILVLDSTPTSERNFHLVDLQGLKKCLYVSERRRIKNLAQINRTLGDQLTRTEKLFFVKTYLGDQYRGRKRKRDFVRRIVEQTRRRVVGEKSRHPIAERVSEIGRAEGLIEANAMQFQLDILLRFDVNSAS